MRLKIKLVLMSALLAVFTTACRGDRNIDNLTDASQNLAQKEEIEKLRKERDKAVEELRDRQVGEAEKLATLNKERDDLNLQKSAADDEVTRVKAEINKTTMDSEQKKAELQTKLDASIKVQSDIDVKLKSNETRLREAMDTIQDLNAEIVSLKNTIKSLNDRIAKLEAELAVEKARNGTATVAPAAGVGTGVAGIQVGGTYQLVARFSNKCADVEGGKTVNGTGIIQWPCSGASNQKFRVVAAAKGGFNLVSVLSGKCVDVAALSTANGAGIQQWDCTTSTNQAVRFVPGSTAGFYQIRFEHSAKCLDVSGPNPADGTKFHQWQCLTAAGNQEFQFKP